MNLAELGRKKVATPINQKINDAFKNSITYYCHKCGKVFKNQLGSFCRYETELNKGNNGYLPICKECLDKLLDELLITYDSEKTAVETICMTYNLYYTDKIIENILKSKYALKMTTYINKLSTKEYAGKNYFNTINEKIQKEKEDKEKVKTIDEMLLTDEKNEISQEDIIRWGLGFNKEEYLFLNSKYNDWITRNECKTQAQEEIFKKLSMIDLQILRAIQNNEKNDSLYRQYNEYLGSANIKPNQQNDAILADTNTFGTFIKKIEDTRPISEPLEEWKDIDGIKKYITVWFFGHLCKLIGLKNKYSTLYDEEVEKYTVHPPTFNEDDNETLNFEDVFNVSGAE